MIFKRRWFRILSVLLALGAFVAYFAFSTLLFPPHEKDWGYDVAALIPREVDFFVAKAGLGRDFDRFPRLAVMDRLEGTEAWRALEESPEFGAFLRDNGIEETLERVRTEVQKIPLGLDPLSIFGGRDLALAGRFRGSSIEQADWAVYGRVNWAGKLAVSLLSYPGILGLANQGLAAMEDEGIYQISGGQLQRSLYVTRVRDVVVVSTARELATQAQELARGSGQESLLLSSDYGDYVSRAPSRGPRRDEFEVIVDLRALLANLDLQGSWPDTRSQRFLPAFLGRIFQASSCKKVMGVVGFDGGMALDLHGGFSSELITGAQRRIYRQQGTSQDEILSRIASLAPADCAMFVYLRGPIDVLLKQVFASVEPALRANLDDAFRSTGAYGSLDEVIEDISSSLHDKLALVVRKNDRVDDEIPHDDQPVFNVSLVTWYRDEEKLIDLREFVGDNPKVFGLKGKDGQKGYYQSSVANFPTREFWSEFVPGTGHVATLNTSEHCYITNNFMMLDGLIKTHTQGGARYPRLADRDDFRGLLSTCIPSANVLVWLNPRSASSTMREQARVWAEENAARGIDWGRKRQEEEQRMLPQLFPGRTRDQLSEAEVEHLDSLVDPALREYRAQFAREHAPQLQAGRDRQIAYLGSASAILAMLRLDTRSFRLSVRVITPLEQVQER